MGTKVKDCESAKGTIKGTVWFNQAKTGREYHSVTLKISEKDKGTGKWIDKTKVDIVEWHLPHFIRAACQSMLVMAEENIGSESFKEKVAELDASICSLRCAVQIILEGDHDIGQPEVVPEPVVVAQAVDIDDDDIPF